MAKRVKNGRSRTHRQVRVSQMIDRFMGLHKEGKSIAEIAKICQVSEATVYQHLGEIAKNHGVERESLLDIPHGPHRSYARGEHKNAIDSEALQKSFVDAIASVDEIIGAIDEILELEQEEQ